MDGCVASKPRGNTMKIMFVINSLGAGGAERSLSELLPCLERDGVYPTVVCLRRAGEGVESSSIDRGMDVRFLPAGGWPSQVRHLRAMVVKERPDLVHTTIFEADVAGRVASIATSVPVMTSLVNTSYDPVRLRDPNVRAWKLQAVRRIDGLTARRCTTHFHAISRAVKDAAVRDLKIDPDDVTVVERGRDAERLGKPSPHRRAQARAALGVGQRDLVFTTVGRQEFQKGQWILLEAIGRLVSTHPDVRLLVAGRSGNASPRLRAAMAATSLNGEVRFLGHRDDAPEILAASDVFVFPSLYEGLGGALIEAMALGLPIVASDLSAIREVVEPDGNAVLVPPGSARDLASALEALIGDAGRMKAMGLRSRKIFEERFTLERSAARMLELFQRVATDGRRRDA